jgi:Helix-turn-helix domain of resolvase
VSSSGGQVASSSAGSDGLPHVFAINTLSAYILTALLKERINPAGVGLDRLSWRPLVVPARAKTRSGRNEKPRPEFETNLRRERQLEGIAKAKAAGVHSGRKPSIDQAQVQKLKSEGLGATEIAKRLNIGRASVYRMLAS